jgi:hypothetical protein
VTALRKFDLLGVSLANYAIERADERDTDISETAERCVRVVVQVLGGVEERARVKGTDMSLRVVTPCYRVKTRGDEPTPSSPPTK